MLAKPSIRIILVKKKNSTYQKIDGPPQTRAFGGVGGKTKSYKYDIGLSTTGWVSDL